jgi:inhibitor of KinA
LTDRSYAPHLTGGIGINSNADACHTRKRFCFFHQLGDSISLETHRRVISLFRAVEQLRDPRIRNLHPAYTSLLIDFDPLHLTHEQLESLIAALILESVPSDSDAGALIEIPVCYEREFAPDLASVAQHSSLTEEQVITAHSGGDYFV